MSPDRFRTARSTLIVDRLMTSLISIGGIGVIAAVALIMVFIVKEIIPLFGSPTVAAPTAVTLPAASAERAPGIALGIDEWGQLPLVLRRDGTIDLVPIGAGATAGTADLALKGAALTAAHVDARAGQIVAGTADGTLVLATAKFQRSWSENEAERRVTGSVTVGARVAIAPGQALVDAGYGVAVRNEQVEAALAAAIAEGADGARRVLVVPFTVRAGAVGVRIIADDPIDVTARTPGRPLRVLVDERAESVVVVAEDGAVHYLWRGEDSDFLPRQSFRPFSDASAPAIASCEWLFGHESLIITAPSGVQHRYSLCKEGDEPRKFKRTGTLPPLPGAPGPMAVSARNRSYLSTSGAHVSLRFGTTVSERWTGTLPAPAQALAINAKNDRIAVLSSAGLHVMDFRDDHPEAGFAAWFSPVWYEGQRQPEHIWQSGIGNPSTEPKYGLMPLIMGTLKGTFFALLFAVPVALLGALYTSEFMHPRFKTVVKPTVEIMAALPSVVLGFLGALYFAPLLDQRIPSLLAIAVLLPLTAVVVGWTWARLPMRYRAWLPNGYEFLVFIPLLLVVAAAGWALGPVLESGVFPLVDVQARDPESGAWLWKDTEKTVPQLVTLTDFRAWWPWALGVPYKQLNAMIVGLMMGFAVIPIIFTIAEDALANVPKTLRSGSLALGASRWQTAVRVVLPTASPGVFSALMIGLGRAIGETMIIVMAGGGTAIMDLLNSFSGMRSLSANIAVEMHEAPVGSTLYRVLFLCAVLLFAFTFLINTIAEVMRQRLREKYKTV